jgi:ribosomal protein S18 acetylase RimI-like enzyme
MRIRRAGEDDYPAISRIMESLFPKAEFVSGEGHIYFVAEEDGKIFGFCHVLEARDAIVLAGIGVLPGEREKGAGSELIDAALKYADENIGGRLVLKVRALNPAIRLYLKKGFTLKRAGEVHLLERGKPT